MTVIPNIKEMKLLQGVCYADELNWSFAVGTDERVINAAYRIAASRGGVTVNVSHSKGDGEDYTLQIDEHVINIGASGAAGAFYALCTLKMLIKSNGGVIKCCNIKDRPDMSYRGFYQDTTRGRIPTLDTLKRLVDTMADYKMNSLQLYVEHSYDFKEYEHCKEKLGYLTKEEIRELDVYCKERFVELVPSLASFGHLYHLLESDKYKHLCELKDYEPKHHYWRERMAHHTINPLPDESFELIVSLIEQHISAFTSNKFNICCDETFDLGRDVNKDKDKGELYVGFVKKLVSYLEAKGKTVLMWGDIILQHPERIKELSDNIIFCSWNYEKNPKEGCVAPLEGRKQYVCPGTSSWDGFHERVQREEGNIIGMTRLGAKYGALGILNTNWGDLGNPASIDMAMYGMILGAAAGWDNKTEATDELKTFISEYHYGSSEAMDILEQMSIAAHYASWLTYNTDRTTYADSRQEDFEKAMKLCEEQIERIKAAEFRDGEIKEEFLIAARADSLLIDWNAHKKGYWVKSSVDFGSWLRDYEENWLADSKKSELDEIKSVFKKSFEKALEK